MPLIKPRKNPIKSVSHTYNLQEPNRETLVLYARFIGDSVNYVLNELIDATLAKDREFVAWRTEHPNEAMSKPARRSDRTGASAGA